MGQVSPLFATLTPQPFVVPISDGSGTLDDWVTGGGGGSSWVPVTTGAEPVALVSNGAGELLLTLYTP